MKTDRKTGKVFALIGTLLIIGAVALTLYNVFDQSRAEKAVVESVSVIEELTPEIPVDSEFDKPLYEIAPDMEMPVVTHENIDYIGTLYIDSLNLKLPIISEWSYPNLKKAPCRYTGSAYKDNMVLAAHNYQSHFGRLQSLGVGDSVVFLDVEGNEFRYSVTATEVLQPTAVEDMVSSDCDLTLFTCTLGGRTRFTVRCDKV